MPGSIRALHRSCPAPCEQWRGGHGPLLRSGTHLNRRFTPGCQLRIRSAARAASRSDPRAGNRKGQPNLLPARKPAPPALEPTGKIDMALPEPLDPLAAAPQARDPRSIPQCGADRLHDIIRHVSEQLTDIDRRHGNVLQDLHRRLAELDGKTQAAKASAPEE